MSNILYMNIDMLSNNSIHILIDLLNFICRSTTTKANKNPAGNAYIYSKFPTQGTYDGKYAPSQPSDAVPGRQSSLLKLLSTGKCPIRSVSESGCIFE